MEKGVIDRIVDGKIAVILVGENEKEYHYPAEKLPDGVKEGTWLKVEILNDQIVKIEPDFEETERVRKRILEKIKKIKKE